MALINLPEFSGELLQSLPRERRSGSIRRSSSRPNRFSISPVKIFAGGSS